MRLKSLCLLILGLAATLTFSSVGVASASNQPPIVVPQIVAATSAGPCGIATPCRITATLTYNTAVAISGNAVPDFTVEDATNEQPCTVIAVTTTAPPAIGVAAQTSSKAIYLTMSCAVNGGDTMLLVYRQNLEIVSGYIYNAAEPTVHALTPQAFAWFEYPIVVPLGG